MEQIQTTKPRDELILKLYFYMHNLSLLRHVSTYLDHLQGVSERQQSIYKNIDGSLLKILKFVYIMSVDIVKFVL